MCQLEKRRLNTQHEEKEDVQSRQALAPDKFCEVMVHNGRRFDEMQKDRQLWIDTLMEKIHEIIPTVDHGVTERRDQRLGSREALLPIIGSIAKSLFGVATSSDLEHIVAAIKTMSKNVETQMNTMKKATTNLASFAHLEDEHLKTLETKVMEVTARQAQLIANWSTQVQNEMIYLSAWSTQMTEWLFHTEIWCQRLQLLVTGLTMLTAGHLSPILIPEEMMQAAINHAQTELHDILVSATLVHSDMAYYYKYGSFVYMRAGEKIIITLQMPVSQWAQPFDIYEIIRIPIMVSGQEQITMIEDLPDVIAVERGQNRFFPMTREEMTAMENSHFSLTKKILYKTRRSDKYCVMNLLRNDLTAVDTSCTIKLACEDE